MFPREGVAILIFLGLLGQVIAAAEGDHPLKIGFTMPKDGPAAMYIFYAARDGNETYALRKERLVGVLREPEASIWLNAGDGHIFILRSYTSTFRTEIVVRNGPRHSGGGSPADEAKSDVKLTFHNLATEPEHKAPMDILWLDQDNKIVSSVEPGSSFTLEAYSRHNFRLKHRDLGRMVDIATDSHLSSSHGEL